MNTQTDEQQPRNLNHRFVSVYMSVFGSFREKLQNNLEQNADHDVDANIMGMTLLRQFAAARVINLRQKMNHGERQQKRPTKSQQQFEVFLVFGLDEQSHAVTQEYR